MKRVRILAIRFLFTALLAIGLGGLSAQMDLVQGQRMKSLTHQWSQTHSSDLQEEIIAERMHQRKRSFIGFSVGAFVLLNLVLAVTDQKPPETEGADSASS